jgi:uncharacterized membrane protein
VTRPRLTYCSILLGALLWCAAILLAPVFAARGGTLAQVASLIYQFFQPLCHQIDSRSFHLFGAPFAVCIRCSAVYIAFLAGMLLYPFCRSVDRPVLPDRRVLLAAAFPMLLDVAAGALGLHDITSVSRTISGAILGAVLPLFIVPTAIEAVSSFAKPFGKVSPERKDH